MAKLKEEFLVFFIEEVQDILDRLEQIMINFEHTTLDEELNRSIKRDFHTLKGDFLTYNFKKYSEYFHKVEDLWEIEEFRPFTAETILKNITEVRIFLKITQNSGLEDAFTFEEKSQMLEELNEENLKNAKNENPKELLLKTNEEKKSEVDTLFYDTTTDIIPNTSNSDNDTHYTFTLNFREDDDLKIEEIEQFFKFYCEILYIKKTEAHSFKTLVSTTRFEELLSNLTGLIGKECFTYEKGGELVTENEYNKISSNIAEIKEIKTIKVNTDNLNFLLNNIGELITKHSILNAYKNDLNDKSRNYFEELMYSIDKITKDIQEEIFSMRLIPARFLFSQLRRIIRDISKELGKDVYFEVIGEDTHLDKEILDKLSAPLKHMLKNSLDHGIETPEERKKAGKNVKGFLKLELYQKGEDIVIEVFDDGRGLDSKKILRKAIDFGIAFQNKKYTEKEIFNFIFIPGFSTSGFVTEISGRGVGMDVVKNNINELNGTIEIESVVKSHTIFKLNLPTTLSVIDGFLIKQLDRNYVVPVHNVFEILDYKSAEVEKHETSIKYNNIDYILVFNKLNFTPLIYLLLESNQRKFAFPIDEVINRRQFIVKKLNIKSESLEKYLGATILATGETALVLNPKKL